MEIQTIFKRYELKYRLTAAQRVKVLEAMSGYMKPDRYGRTTIRNLYYDTDSYLLVRRSIEKPTYKEKLRVRSYAPADAKSRVFVELKKKFDDVVYKRRISLSEEEAMNWLDGSTKCSKPSQIANEIDYFVDYYETLHPAVFLSYEREAFFSVDGTDFRVTFDDNILCRKNDLSLRSKVYGAPILPDKSVLMEIKCSGGIPMWMTQILSKEHIYKTSFSKYGTAYTTMIFPQLHTSSVNNTKERGDYYVGNFIQRAI